MTRDPLKRQTGISGNVIMNKKSISFYCDRIEILSFVVTFMHGMGKYFKISFQGMREWRGIERSCSFSNSSNESSNDYSILKVLQEYVKIKFENYTFLGHK